MRPTLRHIALLLGVLLLVAPSIGHSGTLPDTVRGIPQERFMEFWSAYMVSKLHYGEDNVPSMVVGFFGELDSNSSPANVAMGFLETNRDIFRIDDVQSELAFDTIETHADGSRTIVLQQMCQGLKVVGCHLDFEATSKASIEEINGRFLPNVQVSVQPSIDSATAVGIAYDSLKSAGVKSRGLSGTLSILPQNSAFLLVWQIDGVPPSKPGIRAEPIYVDAHSGAIVSDGN